MLGVSAIIAAFLGLAAFSEAKDFVKLSAFDNCNSGEFIVAKQACTVIDNNSSIPNWGTIVVDGQRGGFLRFPQKPECPFSSLRCQSDKFTYFGWVKFHEYPKCGEVAAYVTSPLFDIHLLSNGHLRVTVRYQRISKKEVQVESRLPVLLQEWYPLILQVDQNSIKLYVNKKSYTESNAIKVLTSHDPTPKNFFVGTDGRGRGFSKMEVSQAYFANHVLDFGVAWEKLTLENFWARECIPKYNMIRPGPFQCYFFPNPNYRLPYEDHRIGCQSYGYYMGYYVARPLKVTNLKIWTNLVVPKIEKLSSRFDYKFWTNVDQSLLKEYFHLKKFDGDSSELENGTCTFMDTIQKPWSLKETSCNDKHALICEMSWECLANSPCQNDGLCQQTDDGAVCHCLEGTSGKFCERGKPKIQMTEAEMCNNV